MSSLLIEGGHRLEGRVSVEGNKNAALPLLAACLLTDQECVFTNVPRIGDVEVMARLLLQIGAEVEGIGTSTLRIRTPSIRTHAPDRALVGRLRGSVLLLSPLLARSGRARIAPPGGDFPARRSISTHLEALAAMGAHDEGGPDHALEAPDGLHQHRVWHPDVVGDAARVEHPGVVGEEHDPVIDRLVADHAPGPLVDHGGRGDDPDLARVVVHRQRHSGLGEAVRGRCAARCRCPASSP
jgi:hypothetical protein